MKELFRLVSGLTLLVIKFGTFLDAGGVEGATLSNILWKSSMSMWFRLDSSLEQFFAFEKILTVF